MLTTIGLSLLLSCGANARTQQPRVECALSPTQVSDGTLRQEVMDRFAELCAQGNGIFSEDVTYLTAPYFPKGQDIEETFKVIKQEGLRDLRPFHGKSPDADMVVYVTGFTLMSAMFSHVYVTIDLEFHRSDDGNLVLQKSMSFLRTSNM